MTEGPWRYLSPDTPIWEPPELEPRKWWTIDYLLSEWTGRRVITAKGSIGGSMWSGGESLLSNWGAEITWWEEGERVVRRLSLTKEQWDKLQEVWDS